MELLFPLCFNDSLTELQIDSYECSDGIYVSNSRFRLFMTDGDDSLIVLSVKRGDNFVYSYIRGTHSGLDEAVYGPSWMCQVLGVDSGDAVELERVHPNLGSSITIKPHTSRYSLLEDPVSELRNAFENYACLTYGVDIPLMVAGELLTVSIIETGSETPVCIRGIELEVKIETPLDREAEEASAEAEAAAAKVEQRQEDFANMFDVPIVADNRFPGRGYRLDGK
jgi:hypothetical protein